MRRAARLPGGVAAITLTRRPNARRAENRLGSGVIRIDARIAPVARERRHGRRGQREGGCDRPRQAGHCLLPQ
jgi:hypothetical protein